VKAKSKQPTGGKSANEPDVSGVSNDENSLKD